MELSSLTVESRWPITLSPPRPPQGGALPGSPLFLVMVPYLSHYPAPACEFHSKIEHSWNWLAHLLVSLLYVISPPPLVANFLKTEDILTPSTGVYPELTQCLAHTWSYRCQWNESFLLTQWQVFSFQCLTIGLLLVFSVEPLSLTSNPKQDSIRKEELLTFQCCSHESCSHFLWD